nr:hypothetical protein REQ54_03963 [Rhizobium sp. Q54]
MNIPPLISLIAGFLMWSIIFVLLYAAQATGCHFSGDNLEAVASDPPLLRVVLSLSVAVATTAMLLLFLKDRRLARRDLQNETTSGFFRELSAYVWAAALVATPFCFGGVAWLTLCGT